MAAKLKSVKAELMRKRHLPVPEQGRWLASVITGHQAYYAVPGTRRRSEHPSPGHPPLAARAQPPQPERPGHTGSG